MGDFNSQYNRVVWFDIPVANLDRAAPFYAGEGNRVALHSETDA